MKTAGVFGPQGTLIARAIPARRVERSWTLKNQLTWGYIWGWIQTLVAQTIGKLFGIACLVSTLKVRVRRATGEWVDYGIVARRLITTAGVGFIVDDWDNSAVTLANMNYHGCGTGTNAENSSDSALQTESTTALNPDSTRATGTRSQPSANIYQSVGTLTFDASAAVTEHGLLSQAATGGGVLFDRSVFSAINVASGDSIQFTYACTITAGG